MLMVHAAAAVAIVAVGVSAARERLWLAVVSAMLVGAALFGGDIALSAFSGRHLFPMAAPTGGTILIASWLAVAVVSLVDRR
jgi:uncharacterized membrane protein YgdD (TMEM256/DUF423 family)